jgi:CO/xanthine dehydrogenase Mo-binding subunit
MDYFWRPFSEIPDVENVILETPFPSHRFHAIGIAEITNAPGPSALLMAASNAIGRWLNEYPVTPDRILKALNI